MKRSEAARYARLSAILAFTLVAITSGIYLHRVWVARVEKKNAPPPPPQDVERQSSSLTFSKGEGIHKVFTVQASKSTDFRGQDASLLEEVTVTVFGKTGERNDVIRSKSCRYSKADGAIQCSGTVDMELQSAADAERSKQTPGVAQGVVHVATSGVTFDRATGNAQTVAPVKFDFPNGNGDGVGAVYASEEGHLRLVSDVHLKLRPAPEAAAAKPEKPRKPGATVTEVAVNGSSLEFDRNTGIIQLHGPVTADTAAQRLTCGELVLTLDEQFHSQTLIASPGTLKQEPQVTTRGANGENSLTADKLTTHFAPEGWIRAVDAEGNVHGMSASGSLQAENGQLEMWPRQNEVKQIMMRGNVQATTRDAKTGSQRHLATNVLRLDFSGGKPGVSSHVQHAETLERGTLEWTDAAAASAAGATGARSKLSGDKLALDFGPLGKARQLVATGAVQTERQAGTGPLQTASAASGVVQLEPTGGWSQITMHDHVRLKEGDRSAEAQQAVFVKADESAVLSGQAMARDASSETRATKIIFHQTTGDVEAEGNVRSTDLSAKASSVSFSSAASNISADNMKGNSKTGRALYTGHARLWQGASVLQADSIDLQRATRILVANGNVKAVFLQAPQAEAQAQVPGVTQVSTASSTPKPKQPTVWHISSGTLTYWDAENRAHLEKDVVVQSPEEKIRSAALDLEFTRDPNAKGTGPATGGASQISRAVATGGVVVEQLGRRGTADRGVYTAADQNFVLSGGTPTLYDATEGTTTGRKLTFNIADDTIIVDSGNGSRTLTKHRVQ
jgi:lipopolysaccharide export system protein LptA